MKSVVNMLRVLLLLLLFSVLEVYSFAFTANPYGIKKSALFQDAGAGSDKSGNLVYNNSEKSKAASTVITLTAIPYQARIAQLHWSSSLSGLAGTYTIQRYALPAGWVDIAKVPHTTLAYNDTISDPFCIPTDFSYRVQFIAKVLASDNAISPEAGPFSLSDLTSPVNVPNLIVDQVAGQGPTISWDGISTDDISKYEIQRFNPNTGNWPIIGSALSPSNSFVDHGVSPACGSSFKYIVRTYDMCGNTSAPDYENKYVQTIKLVAAQPGQCDKSAMIKWNSYKNMPGGLGGYTISQNDGINATFEIVTADTSWVDYCNFKDGLTYTYAVKANSIIGLYSSSSCREGWKYSTAILPDTIYITQVSVEDNSYISVNYYFSPINTITRLYLERSDDNGSTFHTVDSIIAPVPQQFHFNDSTANVYAQAYFYRLVAIDDCDNKSMSMNTSKSIWLQCIPSETQNTLEWNSYESWLQGVEGYDILRTLNQDPSSVKTLTTTDPAATSYSDLLTSFDTSQMPCYWVEAKENPGNHYLKNAISKSNSCCVIKDPIIFMPNAFYPDGKNKFFRPVPDPIYIDIQSFKMTIFSRWGQQLFETTDIVNGWNGSVNGQFTPAGQYVYIITYKSPDGKDYTKRGTVMLVR